jgi:hypothetical protein
VDVRRNHAKVFTPAQFTRASLPAEEWAWLESHWQPERLSAEQILCDTDCASETLWLLDDAVTARVARDDQGHLVEIAVDGPGSVACGWAVSGDQLSPWRVQVRRSGMARALRGSAMEQLSRMAPVFHARCRAVIHSEVLELAEQFALARRRTARSLLAERLNGYFTAFGETTITITHNVLAQRLNLRRATVTLALQELEGARAIRSHRARIELKDRERLIAMAHDY